MKKQNKAAKADVGLEKTSKMQDSLIQWYEENQRKLPWRETTNPYYIWISEVMLQQTKVDTVLDYYNRFICQFPTIKHLAEAEETAVLKAWEGLGYYSRAKRIHQAAKIIKEQYNGQFPKEYNSILSLPGVGPYTAGAIASIAFHQPIPAVDGNVMRVFSRVFDIKEDIALPSTQKYMQGIGKSVVPVSNPSFFNQGLMELGALICTPTSPKCLSCPLFQLCKARKLGIQETLPIKQKKPKQKNIIVEVALIYKNEKMLITKRPQGRLLGGLWGLPAIEKEKDLTSGRSIELELLETYAIKVSSVDYVLEKIHVFTHIKWQMRLYQMTLAEEREIDYPQIKWVDKNELMQYPLPKAFNKLIPF